jgi:hypothetical protein
MSPWIRLGVAAVFGVYMAETQLRTLAGPVAKGRRLVLVDPKAWRAALSGSTPVRSRAVVWAMLVAALFLIVVGLVGMAVGLSA